MSKMDLADYGFMSRNKRISIVMQHGVSFGAALAMVVSFNVNQSILWAIIHGIFSWLYVLYYSLFIS